MWLFEQLAFASGGDAILLLEDAVLAIQSDITLASFIAKCDALNIAVYYLQDDAQIRGLENQYEQLKAVDYDGFVELICQHQKQVAW